MRYASGQTDRQTDSCNSWQPWRGTVSGLCDVVVKVVDDWSVVVRGGA